MTTSDGAESCVNLITVFVKYSRLICQPATRLRRAFIGHKLDAGRQGRLTVLECISHLEKKLSDNNMLTIYSYPTQYRCEKGKLYCHRSSSGFETHLSMAFLLKFFFKWT